MVKHSSNHSSQQRKERKKSQIKSLFGIPPIQWGTHKSKKKESTFLLLKKVWP